MYAEGGDGSNCLQPFAEVFLMLKSLSFDRYLSLFMLKIFGAATGLHSLFLNINKLSQCKHVIFGSYR